MLDKENTAFVLVDVQGKLAQTVDQSEEFIHNLEKFIQGLRVLGIPVIWLEQYPQGLGHTTEQVAQHLSDLDPIHKRTFNACQNEEFLQMIKSTNRKQILIAGIETHVCVYQTAIGLKDLNYEVQVVADAVSSRTKMDKKIGLEKMKASDVQSTSVEMALFELLDTSEGDLFKQVLKHIK